MRVLIVTYAYPPSVSPRALRWSALAEEWARLGHEVAVVCAWLPRSARFERANGVAVHRVGLRIAENLRGAVAAQRTRRSVLGPLRSAAERIWRSLYWPDTSCLWLGPAYWRTRRLLRELRPDAVVSVSPTFSGVLATMAALRAVRPRWLLDLGDPFSWGDEAPPNNLRLYRGLNRKAERAAFRRADAVSVTTEETRAGYAAAFAESAGKIQVVPPLVSLQAVTTSETANQTLSLAYVGTLYRAIRPPDFLLVLFRRLLERQKGIELHVYGDVQDCRPSFERHADLLGRSVFVHGVTPRAEAVEVMRRASVLVNIGNRTPYQLPSKLVEYAALGKPILSLAASAQDSSARFLATYPRHLSLLAVGEAPDETQVADCVRFLAAVANGRLPPAPGNWAGEYALQPVSERYLSLLQR